MDTIDKRLPGFPGPPSIEASVEGDVAAGHLARDPEGPLRASPVPPSRRLWRTLVHLRRLPDGDSAAIWANVPGFAPRLMIHLEPVHGDAAWGPFGFPVIPEAPAARVYLGVDLRVHTQLNIGAEHWEDLIWSPDPADWEVDEEPSDER